MGLERANTDGAQVVVDEKHHAHAGADALVNLGDGRDRD